MGEEGGWMVEDGGQGSSSFAKATADRKVKGPEFESTCSRKFAEFAVGIILPPETPMNRA
jgi:hypothetical protein